VSYQYKKKSPESLEKIADTVRDLFPHRLDSNGLRWDVEGIIDDLNFRIIPRRWNDSLGVEAYVARDAAVLIVREELYSNPRRLRFTLAEELSHKILEYKLWENKVLPAGAETKDLSALQYREIEKDAKALAAELLMPKESFKAQFKKHSWNLMTQCPAKSETDRNWFLTTLRDLLAGEFDVSILSVPVRMRDLHLIEASEYRRYLGPDL
jgi:Zn-dependent peptidase ImmA (M78 family)